MLYRKYQKKIDELEINVVKLEGKVLFLLSIFSIQFLLIIALFFKKMNQDQKNWLEHTIKEIKLVNPHMIPMNHQIGFFFKVNNIEIPEELFKEEFDQISKAYFSVIEKLLSQQHKGL
jgi:maleate cis-trans isomerase